MELKAPDFGRGVVDLKSISANIGVDEQECVELLKLFIDTSRQELKALTLALNAGDLQKTAALAHSIKGAAVNMNLVELADMGEAIESAVKNRCLSDIENLTDNMLQRIQRLSDML